MTGLLIIVLGIIIYVILIYNGIIKAIEQVKNAEKEISIQLDRRGKVFDSLINTVKKYMEHEKGVLTEIVKLRSQIKELKEKNGNPKEIKEKEEELSKIINSGALTNGLNILVENYPDLKASNNMLQLQEEIVSTENKLSYAKQAYNDAIQYLEIKRKTFPNNIIVKYFPQLQEKFEYWELPKEKIEQEEERRVTFD